MSSSWLNILVAKSGFKTGSSPLIYFGVPIFKGKPKNIFLQPIADKIINKLASWKGSLLSYADRVGLVKSMIHDMLIHNMYLYAWPMSLIWNLERAIKRFIWSRKTTDRKVITVAWN